jgi:4-amino-4-deoxy-L-arabinose transferase-like glycosyltransferase
MPLGLSYRTWLWAILAAAFAVRLAAGVWWQQRLPEGQRFGFPDSESYWELGRAIAQGKPYVYGPERYAIFRTPGFPLLLAPLFLIAGNDPPVLLARGLSALLGTIAVAGVAALAKLLFDERAALIAAGIAAIYPEAIALSVFVLSEAPLCPLLVWQLVAWSRGAGVPPAGQELAGWKPARRGRTGETPAVRWAVLAGVLAGLATLMRPSWLLFVPFASVIAIAIGPDRRRQAIVAAVMFAAMCVTLTPWWIRTYSVAGRFVPTTLQVGASLLDGLGPQATGASDMRFVEPLVADQRAADAAAGGNLVGTFEDRLDRRMRDTSLAWTRENPRRVIELVGIKFLRMWSPLPNAAEFRSTTLRLVLALSYTPVILLAGIGVWKFGRRGWPYVLLALPAIYFTLLHVIFVSSIRYRQPAMLPLIVLAAGVLVETWMAKQRREGEWERGRGGEAASSSPTPPLSPSTRFASQQLQDPSGG